MSLFSKVVHVLFWRNSTFRHSDPTFQAMTFNSSPKGHKDEGMEEVADERQVDPTGEQEDEVIDEEAAAEGWCNCRLLTN